MNLSARLDTVRSALFVPGGRPSAIEKARGLQADLVIIDLEDAVAEEGKADARRTAAEAVKQRFGQALVGIRVNGIGSRHHVADIAMLADSKADFLVLPKVEAAHAIAIDKPMLAMIETPRGVYAAHEVARQTRVAGLIVGSNDLRASLRIPTGCARSGIRTALQMIVLAARASDKPVFDGVYNQLDDAEGFAAECQEGRNLGFTGKTLIHPSQIAEANRTFGAGEEELAEARRLVAAYAGGAQRFEGRMIEDMHVASAKALLARAEATAI